MILVVAQSSALTGSARSQLWELWQAAFDGRRGFSRDDEQHAYGGVHVLACHGGRIVGHAAVVARELFVGGRSLATGYVEGVAVDPSAQGLGIGRALMRRLVDELRARHEFGALSTGRARGFYQRLGWERWAGPSYVLGDDGPVRTAADDDGLMVLRFGTSADVDRVAPIMCRPRRGDVW